MKIDITNIVRPSTYAKMVGVNRNAVYVWAKQKLVRSIKIDGVTFIILEHEKR